MTSYCKECIKKQQEINDLQEQIASLKSKLHHQERTAKDGFFGSSTPSSKVPIKPSGSTECQHNHGGGKPGHKGHGRSSVCEDDADIVETVAAADVCPDCGSVLEDKGTRQRTVIDCQPVKMKKLTQLSQIGIKIGGFDSASGVSFHHKTYHLAGGCISLAAAVSANSS